jgi:uncharacterized C2H2 Zn-finger protein
VSDMLKCPRCSEEIEHLLCRRVIVGWYETHFDDGEVVNEELDRWVESAIYKCPRCHEVLFRDAEDANDFLRGGWE